MKQTVTVGFRQVDESNKVLGDINMHLTIDSFGMFENWASLDIFKSMLNELQDVLDTCQMVEGR